MNNITQKKPTEFLEDEATVQEIDRALYESKNQKKEKKVLDLKEDVKNEFFEKFISSLPQVLRWLGVIIIGVSAAIVMINGDNILLPVTRHWVLVGGTAFIGVLGLLFGIYGKETKGARTFFGVGVALIPVLFSQLGAMIFALQDQPFSLLPETLVFGKMSIFEVIMHSSVTIVISSAIAYFGFLTLARAKAKILTMTYLLLNCAILIPCRDNTYIGFIILGQVCLLWYSLSANISKETQVKTFEGLMSRLILFVPLMVIFTRSLFYTINPAFIAIIMVSTGASLFVFLKEKAEKSHGARIGQLAGTLIVSSGWLVYSISSIESWRMISGNFYACVIGLPFALLFAAASFYVSSKSAHKYRATSVIFTAIVLMIAYISGSAAVTSIISIVIGTLYVILGVWQKEKFSLITGSVIVASGLGYNIWQAIELTAINVWITLAILGIGTLVFASCFEMLKSPLKKYLLNFNTKVKTWR